MDEFDLTRPEKRLSISPRSDMPRLPAWLARWRITVLAVIITVALLTLIIISPIFVKNIGGVSGFEWARLSNIGQAYGGASAILAGIALVGIAGSLIIQVRQIRTEQIRLVRDQHNEILRIVLDNPKIYAPVMGTRTPGTTDEVQKFLFATMLMNNILLGYELGVVTKKEIIEETLPSMFATEPVRNWWDVAGKYWAPNSDTRRRKREFMIFLNEEYQRIADSGVTPIRRIIEDPPTVKPSGIEIIKSPTLAGLAIGIGIGFIFRSVLRDRR